MANNQGEIVIKIVSENNGQPTTNTNAVDNTGKVEANPQTTNNLSNGVAQNAVAVQMLQMAARDIYNITMQQALYQIGKYYTMSDDYLGQQQLNVANNVINKMASSAMSIAGGFAVGGPVGAAIAAVATAVSTGLDIYRNYDEERIKLRQMDAQLSFNRQKAGFSLTADSIGENK